jgi:L-histidine Nalpha-methyltransferase
VLSFFRSTSGKYRCNRRHRATLQRKHCVTQQPPSRLACERNSLSESRDIYMNTVTVKQQNRVGFPDRFMGERNSLVASDVLKGLSADQKYIPSKYFYDARGSKLFELICTLPEYYLTRMEMELLHRFAGTITRDSRGCDLVELGSGANWKIRTLLDAMSPTDRASARYVPVDVSGTALSASCNELMQLYPELKVVPLVADFTRDLDRIPRRGMRMVFLFGSTIGNLDEEDTRRFLEALSGTLTREDRFFVGLDMIKPVESLEAAYNDSQDITAQFNKNILLVLNRQLGGNLDQEDFDHVAFFNEGRERVEMHLKARRRHTVHFQAMDVSVSIEKGETIRTEICRKFRRAGLERSVGQAGLRVSRWYADANEWFSIAEIVLA